MNTPGLLTFNSQLIEISFGHEPSLATFNTSSNGDSERMCHRILEERQAKFRETSSKAVALSQKHILVVAYGHRLSIVTTAYGLSTEIVTSDAPSPMNAVAVSGALRLIGRESNSIATTEADRPP